MISKLLTSLTAALTGGGMMLSMTAGLPADLKAKVDAFLMAHPDSEIKIEKTVDGMEFKIEVETEDGMVIEKKVESKMDEDFDLGDKDIRVEFKADDGDEFKFEFKAEDLDDELEVEDDDDNSGPGNGDDD